MSGKFVFANKSLLIFGLIALSAAAPATRPTSQSAMQALANDQIHFIPPPAGWVSHPTKSPDTAYFQSAKADSALQVQWAPKDFQMSADSVGSFAAQIRKDLEQKHLDAKTEMVLPPKIINDRRFDIVIHEKFKVQKFTEDELHLYRTVGPRVMMVTVSCVLDDETAVAAAHKAAEDLLASCKFNRKAFKKTP